MRCYALDLDEHMSCMEQVKENSLVPQTTKPLLRECHRQLTQKGVRHRLSEQIDRQIYLCTNLKVHLWDIH